MHAVHARRVTITLRVSKAAIVSVALDSIQECEGHKKAEGKGEGGVLHPIKEHLKLSDGVFAEAKDSLEVAQEALAQLARVIRTPVQAPAAQSEWQWREEFVSLHTE